jgi:DNA polymerase-1
MRIEFFDVEGDGLLDTLTQLWVIVVAGQGEEPTVYTDHGGDRADFEGCPIRPLAEGLDRLARADRVVAHNGLKYDLWAVNRLHPEHSLKVDRFVDTIVLSMLADPERRQRSLASFGDAELEKVEHDDWSQFSWEMVNRCVQDVRLLQRTYAELMRELRQIGISREAIVLEHLIQVPLAIQQEHGFCLDIEGVEKLRDEVVTERAKLEVKLGQVFPPKWFPYHPTPRAGWKTKGYQQWPVLGKAQWRTKAGRLAKTPYTDEAPWVPVEYEVFNPDSNDHIERRLKWMFGWKPEQTTKTGKAKIDAEVLAELAIEFPATQPLARFARLTKMLGALKGWLELATKHDDGTYRIHGGVRSIGARTLRASHFSPNVAQTDKKDLRMREVWRPSPGRVLVGVDAEGLQERIIAGGCAEFGDTEKAYVHACVEGKKELGTDTHSLTQKAIGYPTRDGAKTFKYAAFFGATDPKLGSVTRREFLDAGLEPPKGSNGAIGKERRAMWARNIPGLDPLIAHLQEEAARTGYITLVGGSKVLIPWSKWPNRKTGARERDLRLCLNSYAMGTEAVVMKTAMWLLHYELARLEGLVSEDYTKTLGWTYVAWVHDEFQFEAEPEVAPVIAKLACAAIVQAGEVLGLQCPMAGTAQIGQNWKETH